MKRYTVFELHNAAADHFAQSRNFRPSHCDVRCVCNDILDSYARDGYAVPHHYSQDKAHKEVCKILANCAVEQ